MADGVESKQASGTSGAAQTTLENHLLITISQDIESGIKTEYQGGRTRNQYIDLARDPSHGNKVLPQGRKEREIGLDLERQGILHNIVRDSTPNRGAEFIDSVTGIKWDIKSFVSHPKGQTSPRKGAFEISRAISVIKKEISRGHHVIIDTRRLTKTHISQLENAINDASLSDKIIWYHKKGE